MLVAALGALPAGEALAQPTIAPAWQSTMSLNDAGGALGGSTSRITQMAWGPGPDPAKTYLYFSSNAKGLRRLEYNPATGALTNLFTVDAGRNGHGVAFHSAVMYLSESYGSSGGSLGRIWRYRDNDGDGLYEAGEVRVAIVEGIPIEDHHVNQIQILGDRLYVGIGTRNVNGAYENFGSAGDSYGESAYSGTICLIDDLILVPDVTNAAGFYPSSPDATTYEALVTGGDAASALPFTSTAADKLRVHSAGTRNPFGLALDGDGRLWFTNNFQRTSNAIFDRDDIAGADFDVLQGDGLADDIHDQFFRAVVKADYGYRNSNWQTGNPAGNIQAITAGFFAPGGLVASHTFDNSNPATSALHDPADPDGLGPHCSADGLDFYDGNGLPLSLHHEAFITRWNSGAADGGDTILYDDVVAVDLDTGQVQRIASGFRKPLDLIADASGTMFIAEWEGSIWRLSATSPIATAHAFAWGSDGGGAWSDRLSWNTHLAPDDRMSPRAWGTARYAVTIDRPGSSPVITVDLDSTVEMIDLHEMLIVPAGIQLTVQNVLSVHPGGILAGEGEIAGDVISEGSIAPGSSAGTLTIDGDLTLQPAGVLAIEIAGPGQHDQLIVTGTIDVDGTLALAYPGGFRPSPGQEFVITAAGSLAGAFADIDGAEVGGGVRVDAQYGPDHITLVAVAKTCPADTNSDGAVSVTDLLELLASWGPCPPPCPGDGDGDGAVDVGDLLALLAGWGPCS